MRPLRLVATDFLARFPDPYEEYRVAAPHNRPSSAPQTVAYPKQPKVPRARLQRPPNYETRRAVSHPSTLDDLTSLYHSAKKRFANMREIDPCIDQYTHMQDMPQADEALLRLRKIASCVKPIMRKRGWRVGTLSEFYPPEARLLGLNVNRGQSILVRLRHPHDKSKFMTFESTLDTMLHELVHIVQGPHDDTFNRLWNELRAEWEALTLKGYTGEGFLGKGQQIGGNLIPRDEMRRRARVDAAKRDQRRQQERAKVGHRVGGARPVPGFAPRDAAAEATLRRITAGSASVTDGCGTGTRAGERAAEDALMNGFRTREEMDEANEIAIQQAAIELMTQEEEQALDQQHRSQCMPSPMSGGLAWDPEQGLVGAPQTAFGVPTPSRSAPPNSQSPYRPPPIPASSKPSVSKSSSSSQAPPIPSRSTKPVYMATRPSTRPGKPVSRLVREDEEKHRQKKVLTKTPKEPSTSTTPAASTRTWQCGACTLINDFGALKCIVCDTNRAQKSPSRSLSVPPPVTSSNPLANMRDVGWTCMWCHDYMDHQWWTCMTCGKMKDHS